MSLVLTFRLTHWAMRHNMISPEQVAFMPFHSAESHVFTFSQTLRSRARCGENTRALFVDLAKAYNRVHLASLWHLLREMNVPQPIVGLLDDWAAKDAPASASMVNYLKNTRCSQEHHKATRFPACCSTSS